MRFRLKIALAMLCLMSLLFALGGTALIRLSFTEAAEREKEHASETALFLTRTLKAVSDLEGWEGTQDAGSALESLVSGQDAESVLLTDGTETLCRKDGAGFEFADWRGDAAEDAMRVGLFRDTRGRLCVQATACLKVEEERLWLSLGRDVSVLDEARERQIEGYRKVYLLLAALCAALSWVLAALLTRPLGRLSKSAREIASGRLSSRSRVNTGDEIGTLSKDFDRMAERVEAGMDEIREAMERQNRFMGSFTHELKTPMTSIIGYADLLRGGTLDPEDAREAADTIFREGKRLERLSMTLLDLFVAEKTEFRMRAASPGEILESTAEQLGPQCEEQGIDVHVESARGFCMLEPDLVRTLLINLMDNARKAMPDGGRLDLSCRLLEDGCEYVVRDTGRGIPPEALSHLTEAFYRVDKNRSRAQGGAGLGLALAARIVEIHHGDIRFESEVGKGTAVTVTLKGGSL